MSVNVYNKAQDKLTNVSGSSSISTKDENGLEVIADAGEEGLYVHLPFDFKYDPDTNEYGYIDKDGVFQTFSSGIDFIAPEFNPDTEYEKGDYCMHEGLLRIRTAETGSGEWNAGEWKIEKLANVLAQIEKKETVDIDAIVDSLDCIMLENNGHPHVVTTDGTILLTAFSASSLPDNMLTINGKATAWTKITVATMANGVKRYAAVLIANVKVGDKIDHNIVGSSYPMTLLYL